MKEKLLLRLALGVSIIGISVLFFISIRIEITEVAINKLDDSIEQSVMITGSVVDVTVKNSTTFIMIEKDEMTTVILFGKSHPINIGDLVQARGKVSEYNGESEIIADEVRVI